jgi:peptide/nickel transport system permease protein
VHQASRPLAGSSLDAGQIQDSPRAAAGWSILHDSMHGGREAQVKTYIVKRLLLMPPMFVGVGIVVFVVMRLIPGSVVYLILAGEGGFVRPQDVEILTRALGLDRPLIVQLADWLWQILRFDFGVSLYDGRPVMAEIMRRMPLSIQLAIMAILLALIVSLPLGMIAALFADRWPDYAIRITTIAGLSIPSFWLGILILLALVSLFRWSPPLEWYRLWENPGENLKVLIWPAVAVAYRTSAVVVRMTRSSMLEVLREDYVRTARAKGLRDRLVVSRHALRNALLPVVTIVGFEIVVLFGGLIITETVFNVPGLGRFLVDSILRRDYTSAQAIVMVITGFVLVTNLVIDLTYAWLDPRIRYA